MDEDEYKDFDSDNTSDPDGFDDEEMSDDESFFARPGEQQQQGASSISSQDPRLKHLSFPNSLPYLVESLAEMDDRLDLILTRLTEAILLKDWEVGFWKWHREFSRWLAMKYPLKREMRVNLVKLYFELAVSPGMEARLVETFSSTVLALVEKKARISRADVILPWRPIYDILAREIFPKGRKTGLTNISGALLSLTEGCQRFFDPRESREMLNAALTRMDGNDINTVIATQAFLVHFLPLTHPQSWLPMMFRLSISFASATFDDQMLDMLSRLAELHVDPTISDPKRLESDYVYTREVVEDDDDKEEDGGLKDLASHRWADSVALGDNGYEPERSSSAESMEVDGTEWTGIVKDVGIFTEQEYKGIMTICLASMSNDIGDAEGSKHASGQTSDSKLSQTMERMSKPTDRIQSLAHLIIYSMFHDAPTILPSGAATPLPGQGSTTSTSISSTDGLLAVAAANASSVSSPSATKYVAGSKALDALVKLINTCESFFHPSNAGSSSAAGATFIWALTAVFVTRWKEEEKPSCKTPKHRRLTQEMKKEFSTSLRTVALLSMFSKDQTSMSYSHACIRYLCLLEPTLTVPAILDRAYPSLTGLEETHRTPAVLTCLAACAGPIVARDVFYPGGRHLLPLLELSLPGIDMNDPMKTISATWFIASVIQHVQLGDLTDFDLPEDADQAPWASSSAIPIVVDDSTEAVEGTAPILPVAEENQALRYSTGSVRDWLSEYINRILMLFEALPEQGGKSLRTGGKTEEAVNSMVQKATAVVFNHLSPKLFDMAVEQIFEYASMTVRPNTVNVIGVLVASLAHAQFEKVFDRFFPLCARKIRSELENGASSVPTTSASMPLASDTTLHAYMAILSGMLSWTTPAILKHQDELLDLLSFVSKTARNERSWSITSRMVLRVITRLTTVWTYEAKFINSDEWETDAFQQHSHMHWGKMYRNVDCKIDWHVPTQPEIDFVQRVIDELLVPTLSSLESSIPAGRPTKEWTHTFCRDLSLLRYGVEALHSFYLEDPSSKIGGEDVSDKGLAPEEFKKPLPPLNAGFILTDPADPRHQKHAQFRERLGQFVLKTAQYLRDEGGDDSTDATTGIVGMLSTYLLAQGIDERTWDSKKKNFDLLSKSIKYYVKQRVLPRRVWVARAELYHASRSRACSWGRKRSALDDQLISKLVDFSLSSYVKIRRLGQTTLDSVSKAYDGTKTLSYPRLLASLDNGVDADQMKGALYIIGSKSFASFSILNAQFFGSFVLKTLATQDQEKPSIQNLVAKITEDTIVRVAEPSTLKCNLPNEKRDAVVRDVVPRTSLHAAPKELLDAVAAAVESRIAFRDQSLDDLMGGLLDLAEDANTHWRYAVYASRYIRALVRRDRPSSPRVAEFFMSRVVDDLPQLRHYAQLSMTKVLHFVKLRTLCEQDDKRLLLDLPENPLKVTVPIDPTQEGFTSTYLSTFRAPIPDDDSTTFLQDKTTSGWLAWDKELSGYRQAGWDEQPFKWDPTSQEAIAVMAKFVDDPTWWKKLVARYAQEDNRKYLSGDAINFIKSLCQIFADQPFQMLRVEVDALLAEADPDRHKQRAIAEAISGLVRGMKHWSGRARKDFWDWLTPLLPRIGAIMKPDTLKEWTMFFEFNFYKRDPRRLQPLVDFVIQGVKSLDLSLGFAFESTKALTFLNALMRCLSWRFDAWSGDFVDLFFTHIGNDFAEIRNLLADNLHRLEKVRWRVCAESPLAFVELCHTEHDPMGLHRATDLPRIEALVTSLEKWREERPSGPLGPSSIYDKHALAVLRYVQRSMTDLNGSSAFTIVLPLLPEIFQMRELRDSPELQKQSAAVLSLVATISPPLETVRPMLYVLLETLQSHKSWHIRLHVLPVLATAYFRGLPMVDTETSSRLTEVLTECLNDDNVEVREVAASALSSILRTSQRSSILDMKRRFERLVKETTIPKRRLEDGSVNPLYAGELTKMHSAILGVGAIIDAFPYTVPGYVPHLIADSLAPHVSDPMPVKTTVLKIAAAFKASHQDTWEAEDKKKFNEEQLTALNGILSGTSYYA